MNLLIDALPSTLEVNGVEYEIRTSFRDCLRAIIACEDNELTEQEKQAAILLNVFVEMPDDTQAAAEKAMWFLDGGKGADSGAGGTSARLYSLDKDSNLIYAAFRQTHGIDLSTDDLHWWEFLALFMDLGSETTFCQLVALRSRVKKGKATKEERQAAHDMGEMFDVPEVDDRTIDEREAELEFLRLVGAK